MTRTYKLAYLGILLLMLGALTACTGGEGAAEARVKNILGGIQTEWGTTGDKINMAMYDYDDGQHNREGIPTSVLLDRFEEWARDGGIDHKIEKFEITGTEQVDDGWLVVSVNIEGNAKKIRLKKGHRASWVD